MNGVTLVAEILYTSQSFSTKEIVLNLDSDILANLTNSNFHSALSLSHTFNIFLNAQLLYIENFDDENTHFILPSFTYTLNDYNSFAIGAMLQNKNADSYYFKWDLSF